MFQNMSKRERILALVVAATLPLMLIFWGVTTFSKSYFANQAKIRGLQDQIETETMRQIKAEEAQQRRRFYRERSLPTDLNTARIQYDAWLANLIEKRAGMVATSIDAGGTNNNKVRYMKANKPIDIFNEVGIKVRCSGTIGQLMTLLSEFYKLDLMHRVSGLTISPIARSGSGAGSEVLTGQLKIEFDISVVSLVDADEEEDFVDKLERNSLSFEEFTKPILARNMFGPANNTPTVSSSSRSFETGEPIDLTLTADDADESDLLKIELLDSKVPGAELTQREGDRRAKIALPAIAEEGRYEVKVRVTDSGFPAKSTEKTIAFNVDKPEPKVAREEPKPKPKFLHAKAAVIRGVVQDKTGADVAWIEVETLGESFRVKVGESFKLDEKKWTIKTIESRKVAIEVDGQLQTYRLGARLDNPESSSKVEVAADESRSQ
jgi:hypothetical protein